jgi:AcrR family transcriptional regulator
MPSNQRRAQLLGVAREVFARRGYGGTSTLDIGREAGVSETLVLKHFGSKEALFRAAVADPLIELLSSSAQQASDRLRAAEFGAVGADYAGVRQFLAEWTGLIAEERLLLLSFLAEVQAFPDLGIRLASTLRTHIEEMGRRIARTTSRSANYRRFDAEAAVYAALAGATAAAIVRDDPGPFLDELVRLIFFGILSDSGRATTPGPDAESSPRPTRRRRRPSSTGS